MDRQTKLTVVIPHLNEPDGNLRRCLLALDAQRSDLIGLEIIVVDNGSRVMPEKECADIDDVLLTSEPNPGPGPARNRGAALASSDIIAFIDSDCVAQPGWAKAIADLMNTRPDIGLIGGDIGILMTDPNRSSAIEAYETMYSYRARLYVERYGFAATGNMAVRKSVFLSVGPFGGIATMEDTDWGQRATASGVRIAFLAEAKVLTPSCKSFAELARRWDRHVAHEFNAVLERPHGRLRWIATTLLVAASPLAELFRIMRTERLSDLRSRALAMVCLARVRFYRARRMSELVFHGHSAGMVSQWNRE